MSSRPSPALVAQRSVSRLPRLALVLFAAAYLLPGVFGRDPWRNEDLAAYGVMSAIAEGRTGWLAPLLGGMPVQSEPLAHWLGALSIIGLSPWVDSALAARIPFAVLLALTLAFTWYACFHLARTEAAQPVAFAFGGEASPVDYARAIADGALLALIATLGLLQPGHETTPELMQLFGMSMALWALAAAPFRVLAARLGIVGSTLVLACSGAPAVAVLVGAAGSIITWRSGLLAVRAFAMWPALAAAVAAAAAWALGVWAWKVQSLPEAAAWFSLLKTWAWYFWPSWLFGLWTLWRWRRHWNRRHLAVPLALCLIGLGVSTAMGGHDRALMLALPGLAVLAAFALPTMKRSLTAAIDWFSVFFLSGVALFVWAMYVAMQTGTPARWSANVARLLPGFEPQFSGLALACAAAGTAAWVALVHWRTSRRQHALWKSLVLPAGGVALFWLLVMTLWLPPADFARSLRPLVERGVRHMGSPPCVAAPDASPSQVAALEVFGRFRVDARPLGPAYSGDCPVMVRFERITASLPQPGWRLVGAERRARESSELMSIYRRIDSR